MACSRCAEQVRAAMAKKNSGAYPLALVCGMGAAILGTFLYSTFFILTGWSIGIVALAVGWMVGTAIKRGSGGAGGRRYQITAVLLTYIAISLSSIPIGIHYVLQNRQAFLRSPVFSGGSSRQLTPQEQQAKDQHLADEQRQLEEEFGQPHGSRVPLRRQSAGGSMAQPPSAPGVVTPPVHVSITPQRPIIGGLPPLSFFTFLWFTIGSPFAVLWLTGPTLASLVNLAILAMGMVLAWRITAGLNLVIFGPFDAPAGQPAKM